MPDEKTISDLITAEQISASDLIETSIPNAMTESGYVTRKHTLGVIADFFLKTLQFLNLNTTAKTICGAINELVGDSSIKTITHTITKDSGVWSVDESTMKKTGKVVSLHIKFKGAGSIASGAFCFQGNLNVSRPLLSNVSSAGSKGANTIISVINSDGNIYIRNSSPSAINIETGDFSLCFTYITDN